MTMMYATLLASLLASAHGFAATPTPTPTPPPGVECSADEEKFFVYSIDPSLIYPFVASASGPDVTTNETVTRGLIGKTWQGVHLSITQGDTVIKPLTVTSPNSLETGGFTVVSEDFCLGYGNWTVKATAPTHPAMASYDTDFDQVSLEDASAPGAPINWAPVTSQRVVDWGKGDPFYYDVMNLDGGGWYIPFIVQWGIFPVEMRASAEAAAALPTTGGFFVDQNLKKSFARGLGAYEKVKVVPAGAYEIDYSKSLSSD
jgi:hypothetical protein